MTTAQTKFRPVAVIPENKEHWLQLRAQDITSTEIAALFGCSPYMTEFELWTRKKNQQIVTIEENSRMKWGIRLETAIAKGVAEDQDWDVRRINRYIRIPELRIGSSFDFEIVGKDTLLEVKNVDGLAFRDGWIVDGENIEAPPHIELQAQHQLAVSQKSASIIAALVGGNDPKLLPRDADPKVIGAIYQKAKAFWDSIDSGNAPAIDFVRDAAFIISLHQRAGEKIFDATQNEAIEFLAVKYSELGREIKELEGERSAAKAEILTMIDDASKVLGNTFSISAGMTADAEIEAFTRKGFRNFRVTMKKAKI